MLLTVIIIAVSPFKQEVKLQEKDTNHEHDNCGYDLRIIHYVSDWFSLMTQ